MDRTSPDAGDIRNTPNLAWQVKSTPELTGEKLTTAMRQAADQAVAAGADYGIVVHRRAGKANPGLWWAYLPLSDLAALLTGQDWPGGLDAASPVRTSRTATAGGDGRKAATLSAWIARGPRTTSGAALFWSHRTRSPVTVVRSPNAASCLASIGTETIRLSAAEVGASWYSNNTW